MKSYVLLAALTAATFSHSASALNIVLTNDDSYATDNIQTLFTALKEAGHSVIMSAPCTGQSGKGGSVNFMTATNVETVGEDQYCVGNLEGSEQAAGAEGTPVMAAVHGIDAASQAKWGSAPDLLISGPNEGNNLGNMTNNSGTLGAANIAIGRGIPAIAVSDGDHDSGQAERVANVVVEILTELAANQQEGQPLLPEFTGLNVNTPADLANHSGIAFSQVGWNPGGYGATWMDDLSEDSTVIAYVASSLLSKGYAESNEAATAMAQAMYSGQSGIGFSTDAISDQDETSEGVLLQQGYITISTIDGSMQASAAKAALTQSKLNGLLD